MTNKTEQRHQPQTTIKTIGEVLPELKWPFKEIANHRFVRPTGHVNESFGYVLKIPGDFSFIRKLWVGYLNHKSVVPGIYSCLDPVLCRHKGLDPLDHGYRETPFDFYILYKQILPIEQVEKMEDKFGQIELKKRIKAILQKVYPFSIK
jgi:hypothetical protein